MILLYQPFQCMSKEYRVQKISKSVFALLITGSSKNNKNAFQISKYPNVLQPRALVRLM